MSASMRRAEPAELAQPYNAVARAFHWAVVALIAMQVSIALILPALLPASAEGQLNAWHFAVGSTVLLLMVLRLAWRLTHTPPPPPADLPPALRALSRATHWGFYAILIALPILGWTAASAYGATVRLVGLIPLPALVSPDKAFAEQIGRVHATVAFLLIALIALHIAGALYHALVKRDGVVRRMLPG